MVDAGVAEEAGLVKALIRKLLPVSTPGALTYIIALVGIISGIAGWLSGSRGSPAQFTVNMLIKPLDAVLVEFTNDAIHLVNPNASIGLTSDLWFSIAPVAVLTGLIAVVHDRIIDPWARTL